MPEHGEAEDGEQDVRLPADAGERRGNKVCEGEVESPVGRCGEGDGLSTDALRVEFGWVSP